MQLTKLWGKSPVTSIEKSLASLDARRATLAQRLTDATARFEAARTERRTALTTDPAADLSQLTRAVRDGEDEVEAIQAALTDLAEQDADLRLHLAAAQDADARAASSKELERIAKAVDQAGSELDSAFTALAKAAAKIMGAIPPTLHVADAFSTGWHSQTHADRLLAIVLAEGLAKVFPAAFVSENWGGGVHSYAPHLVRYTHLDGTPRVMSEADDMMPVDVRQAVSVLITERLRARAAAIADGTLSPGLIDFPADPAPEPQAEAA